MSEEKNGNDNGNENGENGNGKVVFRKADGVEKEIEGEGYICFPVAQEEEPPEEEEEEVVAVKEEVDRSVMGTCPNDPRYQQTNKTKWCDRMYVDYHHCRHLLGDSAKQCDYFYRCYKSICPNSWIERWDAQIKAGNYPRDITTDRPGRPAPCL